MTITATRLHIDVEESERWRRTLSVRVPADLVREERDRAARRLAGTLKLPGFRKGKVPASVVKKQYGPTLQKETLDRIIGEAYRTALTERALQPISEGEVEKVDYKPEDDLTFRISFDVRPDIRIQRISGFTVERPHVPVTDAEVEQVIAQLRDRAGTWHPADDRGPALDGDLVTVSIERLGDEGESEDQAQGYQLIVGEGDAIPDVEAAIRTLDPGTSSEFTVRFPDDFADPERRGQEQQLRISVVDRRTKELPALDDAFARSVGEFEDLDTLRARVRADLEQEAADRADSIATIRLLDQILEANPFEVPRSMVDRYMESVLGDTSKAGPQEIGAAKARIRPDAELGVKRMILINQIADLHGLHATKEGLSARLREMAEREGTTHARVRARLEKAGRLDSVRRELTDRRVLGFLRERSEVRDGA